MSKRFCDTDIWKNQRWFRKLTPYYKLAFCYIRDECNHAGVWNIDCADLMEDLGIEVFDLNKFAEMCNIEFNKISGEKSFKERIRILDKGYLWITGFVQFQYCGKEGKVNPYSAPVTTALQILSGLNILSEALNKGYLNLTEGLPEGYLTPKDKDKDKDIVKHNSKKNGNFKSSGNFKSQGHELYASFLDETKSKIDDNRKNDS
jgi:hypothetical protein